MHDPIQVTEPAPVEKRADLWLWTALLLSPLAMGFNTIVGYTVAHWTADSGRKHFSYLVSAIDFLLCLFALGVSWSFYRKFRAADEVMPFDGRRVFMAKLSMLLSVIGMLLVIAGTLAVVTLHPFD